VVQVDLKAKRIRLEPGTTKNKEGRSLPVYGEMLKSLQSEKEIRDAEYPECQAVFQRHGKQVKNFRKAWASACECADLAGLLFHDLRRTAVRNMVRAGIPEKIAMQISGHKTRSVFDRYNIVSDRDLDLAAQRMEQHLQSLGTISGTVTGPREERPARRHCKSLKTGAGGGGRTLMPSEGRGILSPVRLPVPPLQPRCDGTAFRV
jgi:hypothetical protein